MFIKNLQLTLYLIETAHFSSKIGNKTGCPLPPLHSYSAVNGSLENTKGQEKKCLCIEKWRNQSLCFQDDTTLYVKNAKESIKNSWSCD